MRPTREAALTTVGDFVKRGVGIRAASVQNVRSVDDRGGEDEAVGAALGRAREGTEWVGHGDSGGGERRGMDTGIDHAAEAARNAKRAGLDGSVRAGNWC